MSEKPVVVLHCFGQLGLGGPMSVVQQLLNSDLAKKYRFATCFQSRPAGGLNLRLIREMAAIIRKHRPQLLHVCGLGNEGFHALLAGRLAGCPRILVAVHGTQRDNPPSLRQWIVSRILEPYTLRHADGVHCVCAYAERRKFIVNNARHLFGYVHNAIAMPELTAPIPLLRSSFGFCESDVVVVFVGRVSPQKGILDLCEAIQTLARRGENRLKALIVGDGVERPKIEASAAHIAPGRVVFAGQRNDVFDLIRIGDFFTLPSHHENLPMVLLEAMACQRAVVATDVGGIPEVVVPGETGILVPPHNPEALADAMLSLARDPERCKAYGIAGRHRAETCFSMKQLTTKLDAIYQEMLQS